MTIINQASDGLFPEVIVLARTVAHLKSIARDQLLEQCSWGESSTRLSGALSRWCALGLFVERDDAVEMNEGNAPRRGETLDQWTDRLPSIMRELVLMPRNCEPLFGSDVGTSADFVKGIGWLLAQDIFGFPTSWSSAEEVELAQVQGEKIVQNDTRWNGLRAWARYLGFGTGDSKSFMIDPTQAIREQLTLFKRKGREVPASVFVAELSATLPVLDGGKFRIDVEKRLDESTWRRGESRHLSMSLSFALRRLEMDHVLALEAHADASDALLLTSKGYQTGKRCTHVRFIETTA